MSFASGLLPAVSKCRVSPNFHPFNNRTRNFYEGSDLRNSSGFSSPFSSNSWSRSMLSRKRGRETLIPFCDKNPQSANEDRRALETVLRLYSAIKSRDLEELSDIIGEECRCVSNFVLAFKPLHGKQQAMEFFSYLISNLGDSVEFVVKPVLHDGMNVGVSWKLECNKTHAPLGKGFSFHICHRYQGKLVIRNVEMFMDPLLHIEPLRLMLMRCLVETAIFSEVLKRLTREKKAVYILLSFLLMAASLFFLKRSFSY